MSDRMRDWEREQARQWVAARRGQWDHTQWLRLIGELRRGGWNDLDPEALGRVLEIEKRKYLNLQHWTESGDAWRWVTGRPAGWSHHEFMTLLAGLNCWLGAIDSSALEHLLDHYRSLHQRLEQWRATGSARDWVRQLEGEWGHDDWSAFLERTAEAGFGDLPASLIGGTLEELKRDYWNLRRWEESGEPYRWVAARRGRWDHSDWLGLLASLDRSAHGSIPAESVAETLERGRLRYENLLRWQQSGAALLWGQEHADGWNHDDWLDLLAEVEAEVGEVEPAALGELIEATREQLANLAKLLDRRSATQERLTLDEIKPVAMPEILRLAA